MAGGVRGWRTEREPLEPDPGNAGVGKPRLAVGSKAKLSWFRQAAFRFGRAAFSMSNTASAFTIQLNGEEYAVDGDARLLSLIERLRMRRGRIAVEINQVVVPRANYDSVTLKPGDRVEIVNFVGGG